MRAKGSLTLAFVLAAILVVPGLGRPLPVAALSCGPCPATTTADLNLRAGPSLADAVRRVIPAGAELAWDPFQGAVNGFYAVSYDGTNGWAFGAYLLRFPAGATTTAALNLRAGPSLGAAIRDVMPAGARVLVLGRQENGFWPVNDEGRGSGYAAAAYLVLDAQTGGPEPPVPGTGSGTATVTVALNLRSGPGLGRAVLLVMPAGATVAVGDMAGDGFVAVTYNGIGGWAFRDYLQFHADGGEGFAIGDLVVVATDALNYRTWPGLGAGVITTFSWGTQGAVTDGPVFADGYTWYEFSTAGYGPDGATPGWVAGDFLALA